MKKFISTLILATVAGTGTLYAQYAGDALRFSQGNYGSSSRFKGLGGAQIGLGGDISSLGGNPAGLGMFTRSEFSITPEFNNSTAKATYLGQNTDDSKSQLNLNQAGAVFYSPIRKRSGADLNKGALSVVWGIGYNKNNDFSANYSYEGQNNNNSIADYFSEIANGRVEQDFTSGSLEAMAYDNLLIDAISGNLTQYQPATSQSNYQQNYENRTGSTSELNIAAGLNISNQLYLGASVGLVNVRYDRNFEYLESGRNVSTDPNNGQVGNDYLLSYRQNQISDGSGINGRLGLIFKPTNAIRVGATFQTPTWLHIQDNYTEVLNTDYTGTNGRSFTNTPTNYPMEYNLRTPYKGSLGASMVIGNNALISADVDYVDYASMKFSSGDYMSLNDVNNNNADIQDLYTNAINYRVGAEYKIGVLSLRAGLGVNGSPLKDDDDNVFNTKFYSGGLGYRVNNYYFDLAYQRVETVNSFSPYTLDPTNPVGPEPTANVDFARNNVFLTFGLRF
jgi:hypothetical protein